MFPIRDHNPTGRTPFVVWTLIAINVLVFLAMLPSYESEQALSQVIYTYGLVPDWVTHGSQTYTLLTAMFLHGGFMHLAGNMLFLWIFGDNLEEALGHVGFALFYLVSGLGAAAAQILPDPSSMVPMVGASGAIAGVMGGYLLLYPRAQVDVLFIFVFIIRIIPLPAWLMIGIWFAIQVLNGASVSAGDPGVAYWAHVGGFITGVIWVLPVWLRRGGERYWRMTHGEPPHSEASYRLGRSDIPVVRRRR